MDYLYEELLAPTRLYIKQCSHCEMKYFGKTISKDIEKYSGSGLYWSNHLKKHDAESVHLWNSDWYHDTSISRFALKFSYMNRIVESKTWANMIPENGLESGWYTVNKHFWTYEKRIEHNRKVSGLNNLDRSLYDYSSFSKKGHETRRKKIESGEINPATFSGRKHTEETKQKMSGPREKSKGERNSQFGTMWITNGTENKKIKKIDIIPEGWYKGRIL